MRKLATDRRPDLGQLLGRAEPVKPRHQGRMQACGDGVRRGGNRGRSLHCFPPGLQNGLCHLFDEQRDAVGALDDVFFDVSGQRLVADDAVDHAVDLAMTQTIEDKSCHMRLSDPGRLELRPKRHDYENGKVRNPIYRATERFQTRRVAPVRILHDHQHGARARQGFRLPVECLQRLLPSLFRGKLESGVAPIVGE